MKIVGVDIGGTFTDFICVDLNSKTVDYYKVPSTPKDHSLAFVEGLESMLSELSDVDVCIHGTTVATNTLIQRVGAITGFLTTEGFRDVTEIMRSNRPYTDIYNLQWKKPSPLVPRYLRAEVKERTTANGSMVKSLDDGGVRKALKFFLKHGVEAVAIGFMFSYANPEHERKAMEVLLEDCPGLYVSISSDVLPEWREYERFNTTIADAYIKPVMSRYFSMLGSRLQNLGYKKDLYIMKSNGGYMTAKGIMQHPITTFLSGPAAGVVAANEIGQSAGRNNIITMDMGGTSLDVSLVQDGKITYSVQGQVEASMPLRIPMVDVRTIGAGGGSIAWLDPSRVMKVGPLSAGSEPGPACYGQGGEKPTVTDANLALGRLNPQSFLGGRKALYPELAEKALTDTFGETLSWTSVEAAKGILQITTANIVKEIRSISAEVGFDPRDFALVAFGGAGPLHAVDVCQNLGIRTIIVPPHPGVVCAMGLLLSDMRYDNIKSYPCRLKDEATNRIPEILKQMIDEGVAQLHADGYEGQVTYQAAIDMKYAVESYEIMIPVAVDSFDRDELAKAFDEIHKRLYGFLFPDTEYEILSLRMTVIGPSKHAKLVSDLVAQTTKSHGDQNTKPPLREVFDSGTNKFVGMPIYSRNQYRAGYKFETPAIIEEMDATTYVPSGWHAHVDASNNIIIQSD